MLVVTAALIAPAVPSFGSSTSWRYKVHHGIRLTRLRFDSIPNEVRVIRVTPSRGPRIDLATAGKAFPMGAKTSSMAAATPKAVLATNGDFGARGAPKHATMVDGELWTSGIGKGAAFAISDNGESAFIGTPQLKMKFTQVDGQRLGRVAKWNAGAPKGSAINGFTSRGGSVFPVPGVGTPTGADPLFCESQLMPEVGYDYSWSGPDRTWITRRYVVQNQPEPCSGARLNLSTNPGAVVLATNASTTGGDRILALTPGDSVRLWWSFVGWPGVTDVVGGSQQLIAGGVDVAPHDHSGAPHILDYNPRTAVGILQSCSDLDPLTPCAIYLITVDGRQATTNWSLGSRLPWLTRRFRRYGVWDAVNLDGGGSTTVWAKDTARAPCESYPTAGGCLAQRPSESGERGSVTDAVAVLSTADPGTPPGLR